MLATYLIASLKYYMSVLLEFLTNFRIFHLSQGLNVTSLLYTCVGV